MSATDEEYETYLQTQYGSPMTVTAYLYSAGRFLRWLGRRRLTTAEGVRWVMEMRHKGQKDSSLARHLAAVRVYYHWKGVPAPEVPALNPQSPETVYLPVDAVEKLKAVAVLPMDLALIMLAWEGALRNQELRTLTVGDVREIPGFIRVAVAKRQGGREYDPRPVSEETKEAVESYLQHVGRSDAPATDILFMSRGKPLSERRFARRLARLCRLAGVSRPNGKPYNPHSVRHGRATQVYRHTKDARIVQALLGHSSAQATVRYTHIEPEDLKSRVPPGFKGGVE